MQDDHILKPLIFLVTDQETVQSSFKDLIENDFEVTEFISCRSVFEKLDFLAPDLIIIDMDINNDEAYQMCRQIKYSEKYHFIPVIFKGPSLSSEQKVKLIESGADDYYDGSFDKAVTINYLNTLTKRRVYFKHLSEKDVKPDKEKPDDDDHLSEYIRMDKDLFKAIFQQSAVGIVQVSPEGNFLKANDRFCKIVGYTREELMSMNFMDVSYPDKDGFEEEMISWVLAGQINSYEVEKRYVHKNGSLIWVKLFSSILRDKSGAVKSAVGIVEDISSRKKAEMLLHENESLFRSMYESSGMGIVRMSVNDKTIEQANEKFCNMLGYTEKELVGKRLRDISYYEDLPENVEKQKKLASGEISSIQMEKRYIHKDGHHVWGLLNANLIFSEQGEPLYFIGNVLDITESKKSHVLLEESEKKYRTYVDNSPYPIFVADFKGNYVDVNPAACAITGYSQEELTNMKIIDLCAPESWDLAAENIRKLFNGEKPADEYLFIKKDGSRFYMLVASVLIDETILGICVDTTERKMTEKLLIEAKMLAENTSKSKTEFVANVSHELRTPLNIVIGYSDILLAGMKGELSDDQHKYVSSIKDAGSNLLEVVNSLIYIAEIEAGDFEIHLSCFDIASAIENIKKITRPAVSKKNLSINFKVGSGIDNIVADKSKFLLIIHHLIGNAIKFTPDSGSITVHFEISDTDLHVSVTDTGVGIPEEEQERLFDLFVQLDWSHSRKYSGVGIGLALVKELIEMHGGSIGLESKVGKGTRFMFTIPQKNDLF